MRNRTIIFNIILILALLVCISPLHAWTGDTWGSISRQTILRIADEMIDFSWSPKNTITNYGYTFYKGTIYRGEAYCQENPQENWAEFYSLVNNTAGGTTYYGNDCSGFVSISWKLPTRYTTTSFESDATSDGGYVTSLGTVGSGKNVGLLLGDAFVASGSHIIMFEYYLPDGSGIKAMEQTPYWARRRDWSWSQLASYRPIRRNNIDEGDYVFKTKWGTQGNLNGQFNDPVNVATDSSGNVYVTDYLNHRVQKFTSSGGFITKWGSYGSSNGYFKYPNGISVDTVGYVYVADEFNNRIQKFTSSGGFITKWGSEGSGNGQFMGVLNLTANTSNVYVSDAFLSRIQKFTSSGGFITKWGSEGSGNGEFDGNNGIAVDSSGNVYVADAFNDRIQKFTNSGGFITKWGACCSPDGYFNNPEGIAVDPSLNVYVADTYNHRIQKFDSNGNFITKWGSNGYMEDGKFQYPDGVAIDSSLNVYVADTGNDRIQKFSPVSKLPSGPSNLVATIISSSQINLSWQDNSNNETGFVIKRKTGVSGSYSTIATVGANVTTYSDPVSQGCTYYYAVYAYNAYGDSVYSDEVEATSGTGTVIQRATLDGSPWSGSLTFQCSANGILGPVQTVNLPVTATNRPTGTRTCAYISGGPQGATFYGIAPLATQTLYNGGTITFTYAFSSGTGTIIHQATLNGSPWSGSLTFQCSANGILGPVQTVNVPLTSTNRPTGPRTCAYISGGPTGAVFTSITPSNTQILYPGITITFTYNF